MPLFIPELAAILPTKPTRVSDRWLIPKEALKAIFGKPPLKSPPIYATLQDVRPSADGKKTVALISVAGKASLPPNGNEYTVNSQISFTYDTPPPTPPGTESSGLVDVVGEITDLRLAMTTTGYVAESKKRLLTTHTNELVLERKRVDRVLPAPPTPPAPTQDNSWLTYTDPDGRFHFRHPQDLKTEEVLPGDEAQDAVVLIDSPPARTPQSVIKLELVHKTGNAETDRKLRDPDSYFSKLKETWAEGRHPADSRSARLSP